MRQLTENVIDKGLALTRDLVGIHCKRVKLMNDSLSQVRSKERLKYPGRVLYDNLQQELIRLGLSNLYSEWA